MWNNEAKDYARRNVQRINPLNGLPFTTGEYFHQPTGISLAIPDIGRDGPDGPHILTAGPGQTWIAQIDLWRDSWMDRARRMWGPNVTWDDDQKFHKFHGSQYTVRHVADVGTAPTPWSDDLLEVLAVLVFLAGDPRENTEPANPDRLVVEAPELPKALRKIIVNPYAKSAP